MPYDEAERNMRAFARDVLPQLRKLEPTAASAGRPRTAEKPGVGLLGS
jgi:hypothetical protein